MKHFTLQIAVATAGVLGGGIKQKTSLLRGVLEPHGDSAKIMISAQSRLTKED